MTTRWLASSLVLGLVVTGVPGTGVKGQGQTPLSALPTPGFHHLHMNSSNPSSAIDELMAAYPSSQKVVESGFPGIKSANDVLILFTRVDRPPPVPGPDRVSSAAPQTAFWHHVWASTEGRRALAELRKRIPAFDTTRLIPQYTGPEGQTVDFSSDTFSGFLTTNEVIEARRQGLAPVGRGGYFNWYGPDGVVMETADGGPEAYRIVGMFQEQPYCAVLWYRRHLSANDIPQGAGHQSPVEQAAARSDTNCRVTRASDVSWPSTYRRGHYRNPPAQSVFFDNVQLRWYMNQEDHPLAPTRGQLLDHIALAVTHLDRWVARLKGEGVTFLEPPYKFGTTRAVMIEGPSREALELVETK